MYEIGYVLAAMSPEASIAVSALLTVIGLTFVAVSVNHSVLNLAMRLRQMESFVRSDAPPAPQNPEPKVEMDDPAPQTLKEILQRCIEDERRTLHRTTTFRYRVLEDLKIHSPALLAELTMLQKSGDGRWLGAFFERLSNDPIQARDLIALRRQHENRGWRLASIEPAYDTADGLKVWLELERVVTHPAKRHMAA